MLDIILIILGSLCLIVGLLGCILPIIPGPPISYAGLLLLHITDKAQFSTSQLLIWLFLVVIVQVLDYFTPMIGSKYSGGMGQLGLPDRFNRRNHLSRSVGNCYRSLWRSFHRRTLGRQKCKGCPKIRYWSTDWFSGRDSV